MLRAELRSARCLCRVGRERALRLSLSVGFAFRAPEAETTGMSGAECACYETGPIRPPSEGASLLVRVTRNCSWNRCTFCPVYKGQRFSLRPIDEVKADVQAMAATAEAVRDLSHRMGYGGAVTGPVVRMLLRQTGRSEVMQVALFLGDGGQSVFLQDANSLILPVDRLVEVLDEIRRWFPTVSRVTSYARSRTLCRRSVHELERLRGAGLNRIHVGLESGCDEVLRLVEKGVTAEQQIDAGRRVKAAGIELSEYVMPGLGGRALSDPHARDTARALREIDPDFVRLRTLAVPPGSPLEAQCERGEFELLDDVGVVREIGVLLDGLEGMTARVVSDHVLNLLEEIEGQLPDDLPKMGAVVDRFLALGESDQEAFIVARRIGLLRRLEQLDEPAMRVQAELALDEVKRCFPGPLHAAVRRAMLRMV